MKRMLSYCFSLFLLMVISISASAPSTINYQGFISNPDESPITDGNYSLTFTIYDALIIGESKWTETQSVDVAGGSFTVTLGTVNPIFDTVFNGPIRYLGVQVESDAEISPRLQLNTVPYAFATSTIDQATGGELTSGITITPDEFISPGNVITVLDDLGRIALTISLNAGGVTKLDFYDPLDSKGGSGASAAPGAASALKMRITPFGINIFGATPLDTVFSVAPNGNISTDGLLQIGSSTGGDYSVILGNGNTADGDSATVGGGANNDANARISTVAGGFGNSISAASEGAVVSGGGANVITGTAQWSVISGGAGNTITQTMGVGFIGSGFFNTLTGNFASIINGAWNEATGTGSLVVGGGLAAADVGNKNTAAGVTSSVLGGQKNHTIGSHAVVVGGYDNQATTESFAAGKGARAIHANSFVWSDGSQQTSTSNINSFIAKATGGVKFHSDTATGGVFLPAGASAWQGLSDSTVKRNIREVDYGNILEKLAEMPISQWSYKSQDESIEHIGPMAQDFYRLFGLGEDDRHISTLDPDGVALAAIKALYFENQQLKEQVEELEELKILVRQLLEKEEQ